MSYKTITLSIKCLPFMSSTHKETLTGFLLQQNSSIYLLSVHHYLPIEAVYEVQTESRCNILINSCWSEALIMDSHNIDTTQFLTFKKIQNSIKSFTDIDNINNEIFSVIDGERTSLKIIGTAFEPFDNLNYSPDIPYLIGRLNFPKTTLAGNSGSPVFIREGNEDILIGVLTKHNLENNTIYIIPIYVYIKCLEKRDNLTIYGLDCTNATKIGAYNISNDVELGKSIYHPTLKVNIPLSTYFLLEGDSEAIFTVSKTICKKGKNLNVTNDVTTISINHNLIVSHEESLLFTEQGRFKINLRLLSLFKRIINPEMQRKIFSRIQNNLETTKSNDFWMDLKAKS